MYKCFICKETFGKFEDYCYHNCKEKWEEEFKNYEVKSENNYNVLQTKLLSLSLNRLVRKYFKTKSKVNIKAKEGKIVIERIK